MKIAWNHLLKSTLGATLLVVAAYVGALKNGEYHPYRLIVLFLAAICFQMFFFARGKFKKREWLAMVADGTLFPLLFGLCGLSLTFVLVGAFFSACIRIALTMLEAKGFIKERE
ncbi:hypothetical protein EBZ39_15735 [bacterium]|nr:hypothetical protein [bacterium]